MNRGLKVRSRYEREILKWDIIAEALVKSRIRILEARGLNALRTRPENLTCKPDNSK